MDGVRHADVRALGVAVAASALIVLGSPYIGQLRAAVQSAVPGQYRTVLAGVVAAAVLAAVAAAFGRIRERRAARYAAVVTALVTAAAYARISRTGNLDRDLVEQFHFVEYGLLTYLFHRAWRSTADARSVVLPACAAFTVGVADEWFQWFVPERVGEFHDVLIDGAAVGCGVLFSVGIAPPAAAALPRDRRARRTMAVGLASVCIALTAFIEAVHRGYVIPESDVGRFRSTLSRASLESAAAERSRRWRAEPPASEAGIAREDHYLTEGRWHVQRRNEARDAADFWTAWNENLILEKYFAPVLDLGSRWSADDRAALAATSVASASGYLSDAEPYPIVTLPAWRLWSSAAALVAAIWLLAGRSSRPEPRPAPV